MLKLNGLDVKPTMFPDGTSQVWKLPKEALAKEILSVTWRFESERELLDIYSLREACLDWPLYLYIPYLPYARQDKEPSNHTTHNLYAFGRLINGLHPDQVTCLDVHNPIVSKRLIDRLENVAVTGMQMRLIADLKPDTLVYPDHGAKARYSLNHPFELVFKKTRHAMTGEITGHELDINYASSSAPTGSYLIVDDICDGGATFLSIAKFLRELNPACKISLFVTHGIFSKGRKVLEDAGIEIFTTDSLPHNTGLKGVFPV
jgi:ribose-phosphate pyrophosphokinase